MEGKIMRLPYSELVAVIVATLFFCAVIVIMILFPNDTTDLWTFMGFGIFVLLGISIIVTWLLWSVEYNDEVFVYRNHFGRRTTMPYSSIQKVELTQNAIHLYANGRRYTIKKNSKGEAGFLEVLSKQLQDHVEIIDRLV